MRLELSWLPMERSLTNSEGAVLAVGRLFPCHPSTFLLSTFCALDYVLSRKEGSMSSFLIFEAKYEFAVLPNSEYGAYYPLREARFIIHTNNAHSQKRHLR